MTGVSAAVDYDTKDNEYLSKMSVTDRCVLNNYTYHNGDDF